jgi:single-stranded-DNA-specific exonuclease
LKRWILPPPLQTEQIETFSRQLGILPLTAAILINRGMTEIGSAQNFMDAGGKRFRDFRDLPGALEAGQLLADAIQKHELIAVFGDYDVDGITSAALMAEFIRLRHGHVTVQLPDRNAHGYGLNAEFVKATAAAGARLLVTVDCGVTAVDEIALARSLGLKTLVTDHHEPGVNLPGADVIVNPKVSGPKDLHILAGVGVALQVIRAASHALGENPEILRRHLDLVALGTVADVVPLIGENRLLTRAGLSVINRGHRLGLKALVRAADLGTEPLSSTHLAFRLAPRLNAAGRMGDARHSLDLLLADDANQAEELALLLNRENSRRQTLEQDIIAEAETQLSRRGALPLVIVISGPQWPLGVMGLVASKICEKYHRPCFILSESDSTARGSGRSIPGFPLYPALAKVSDLLEKWGGHEMAAGVTLKLSQRAAFDEAMQAIAAPLLLPELLQPALAIDACNTLEDLNPHLIKELKAFEPFGFGNVRPVFMIDKLKLCQPARVVGERHLKLKLTDGRGHFMDAIGFGLASRFDELSASGFWDVAGQVSENVWNGVTSLQIEIKDFRAAE